MVAMENGHPNLISAIPFEAREVLHKLASAWSEVADPEALEVVLLKGAGQMATNKVFEIKWKSNNLQDSENENTFYRKVLLRIYGEGTESVFDREDEIRVFEAVSRQGQGPKLLGRFPNGRAEEFITGRTLAAKDLHDPEISAIIATKLREFHDLDMPGPKKVILWDRLKNYLKIAERLSSPEEAKEFYLDKIEEEISSLENELSSEDQMIGFCHNDLWHGNMIMNEETKMLTIIDYELACFNPVAFDIASYFCEMATDFNAKAPCIWDYNKYPNLDERKRFVQMYLNSSVRVQRPERVPIIFPTIPKVLTHRIAQNIHWPAWPVDRLNGRPTWPANGAKGVIEEPRPRGLVGSRRAADDIGRPGARATCYP